MGAAMLGFRIFNLPPSCFIVTEKEKSMYNILVPKYTEDGFGADGKQQFTVSWEIVGTADSMEAAKKFTPHPVLEVK